MVRRDVIPIRRQPTQVSSPSLDQLTPPITQIRRHLDTDVRHQALALLNQPLHLVNRNRRGPIRKRGRGGRRRRLGSITQRHRSALRSRRSVSGGDLPAPPPLTGSPICDVGYFAAVVVRVRDVVLEDDFLEVAMALMDGGECLQGGDALVFGLADADQDARRERDFQLAGGFDGCQAAGGVLGRGAGVDSLHQALGDRLEHQALGGGDLAKAGQVRWLQHAEVGVREQATLHRPGAGPGDVRREVLVSPFAQPPRNLLVDLRSLSGQHE
jgi:hypothetical protein